VSGTLKGDWCVMLVFSVAVSGCLLLGQITLLPQRLQMWCRHWHV